jgi:hypothetical protein
LNKFFFLFNECFAQQSKVERYFLFLIPIVEDLRVSIEGEIFPSLGLPHMVMDKSIEPSNTL